MPFLTVGEQVLSLTLMPFMWPRLPIWTAGKTIFPLQPCFHITALSDCRKVLVRDGICVVIGGPKEGRVLGPIPRLIRTLMYFKFVSQKVASYIAKASSKELLCLCEFLKSGQVVPVIERTYNLNEVPEAMRYLGTGHARGKLVISL